MQVILRVKNYRGGGEAAVPSGDPDVISFDTLGEAATKRTALNEFIFGAGGTTSITPVSVLDISDPDFNSMPNLDTIDQHTFTMEFGITSVVYHFNALTPNGKMIIYHHGHFATLASGTGYETIAWAVANNYDVAAFEMPLYGKNNQPSVCPPAMSCFTLNDHNEFALFAPTTGHSLRFFVEPVIAWLNYSVGFTDISMIGLSGGGWATTLAAAMDTRIDRSFPIAGSMPLFARIPADMGDWEQNVAALYTSVANYSELYVLGAVPAPRKQMQILNIDDSCCFASDGSTYTPAVIASATALGGDWSFWQETTIPGLHATSVAARAQILTEL